MKLKYLIASSNKKVYIRLNAKGSPETCTKQAAQYFESSKAKNIADNLPKFLRKFHFKVVAVPDEIVHKKEEVIKKEIIINKNYKVTDSVANWLNRVKNCNDLAKDATKRNEELIQALSGINKALSNCLHEIELENWRSGSEGYKQYKKTKLILEERRHIKDEMLVVQAILSSNLESIAFNKIEKVVNGLNNRVFEIREVGNYENM